MPTIVVKPDSELGFTIILACGIGVMEKLSRSMVVLPFDNTNLKSVKVWVAVVATISLNVFVVPTHTSALSLASVVELPSGPVYVIEEPELFIYHEMLCVPVKFDDDVPPTISLNEN